MSTQQVSGVSQSYVDSAIQGLRNELKNDMAHLQNYVDSEIRRLEAEMREIGEMIVRAIDRQVDATNKHIEITTKQTIAIVGGVAATTAMIERTKNTIEEEVGETNERLEKQTESHLQIELGKMIADATALKAKLTAFIGDIKSRFDKSLLGVQLNRNLYDLNFRKIMDEYANKVRTIGAHILQVRDEDIAPAVDAAQIPYEAAHSLPIEMDLLRLEHRSENLDGTLQLLKSTRLDNLVNSLQSLDAQLAAASLPPEVPEGLKECCVEAIGVLSFSEEGADRGQVELFTGRVARQVQGGGTIELIQQPAVSVFSSARNIELVSERFFRADARPATPEEKAALLDAARQLLQQQFLSPDVVQMFEEFLREGSLEYVEN